MYIRNTNEFNQISGENLADIDLGLLKKANMQVDAYISPQVWRSPFSKAFTGSFALTVDIAGNQVTLDKEYKSGFFEYTVILVKGIEYEVLDQEIANLKTVLTIDKNLGTLNAPIRIYQKTQAPFLIDTIETENLISKVIRVDIKEAVFLQYQFLQNNPNVYTNQLTKEKLDGSNYEVEFRDGMSTTTEQLVSPEAKAILEKYKTYL